MLEGDGKWNVDLEIFSAVPAAEGRESVLEHRRAGVLSAWRGLAHRHVADGIPLNHASKHPCINA